MAGLNASGLINESNNKAEQITGLNKEEKVGHACVHVRHVCVCVWICARPAPS